MVSEAPGSANPFGADASDATSFLSLHAVRIFVRDLDRSLAFYLDQLGFRLVVDTRIQSGERWVASLPAGWHRHPHPRGPTTPLPGIQAHRPRHPGRAHHRRCRRPLPGVVAQGGPVRERAPATPDQVRAAYGRVLPVVARPGPGDARVGRSLRPFRDPDGNTFALVSLDEVTHAAEAARRVAAERREADRRAAHELAIAREVQIRLFPQSRPALRSLDYAGVCVPARAVGGDYYDFLSLGPDRLGLVVGDVMGKGMAAALLMANLQANVRSRAAFAPGRTPTPPRGREPSLLRELAGELLRQPLLRGLSRRHRRAPLRQLRPSLGPRGAPGRSRGAPRRHFHRARSLPTMGVLGRTEPPGAGRSARPLHGRRDRSLRRIGRGVRRGTPPRCPEAASLTPTRVPPRLPPRRGARVQPPRAA